MIIATSDSQNESIYFVKEDSIVRRIWGNSDTILLIFAGAAGEFALSKAVDWLFFTGKLPADPIGRLFSTVTYARAIVFSEKQAALHAIDTIAAIHTGVEKSRGYQIPDWAYKQVLFMLIHYSVRAFEVLEHKLNQAERQEVIDVFLAVGGRMGLDDLPTSMEAWDGMHKDLLENQLLLSENSKTLFRQYRKHLGSLRYYLLKEGQNLVVPSQVRSLLGFRRPSLLYLFIPFYKLSRLLGFDGFIKGLILPQKYQKQISALDIVH